MEATASAAPSSGAGTGSAQSGSPSSQSKASNSAGQTSPTQRPSQGAAQPSSSAPPAAAVKQQSAPADDDPEIDFGNGRKAKRSQVINDFHKIRGAQSAADKRAQEAIARAEKAEAIAQHLQKLGIDPERFAKDPQAAAREYANDYVRRQIEEADMDPRDLELQRREESLKERETRIERETRERQEAEEAHALEQTTNTYAQEMHEVLSTSNLPRDPYTVARLASLMLAAARSGARIPKEKLGQALQQQVAREREHEAQSLRTNPALLVSTLQTYLSGAELDGAQIADALGEQHTEALRKHLLQTAQSKFNGQPTQQTRPRAPRVFENKAHPNGYHTLDEWNEAQRKRDQRK